MFGKSGASGAQAPPDAPMTPRGSGSFDHAQHHLDGDGGVDRRTAARQHLEAGLDGQGMSGGHYLLRLRARCLGPAHQQDESDSEPAAVHARRATMNRRRKGNSVTPSARVG